MVNFRTLLGTLSNNMQNKDSTCQACSQHTCLHLDPRNNSMTTDKANGIQNESSIL